MPLIPVASTSTGHAEPSVIPSARAPRTQRTRHAGTELDSAPAPVVRKRDPKHSPKTVPSRAAMRLLAALDRPRRGSELSALLGVSRERVRQLIGQLADMGLVRSANPGRRTTVVARHDDPTLLLAREQARVLNRFMEAEAATVSQITMHIGMRVAMVGAVVEFTLCVGDGRTDRCDEAGHIVPAHAGRAVALAALAKKHPPREGAVVVDTRRSYQQRPAIHP